MKLSPFKMLLGVLIVVLMANCASTGVPVVEGKLPTIDEIVTPQQADRALVISQGMRVGARDYLANKIKADKVFDDEEKKAAARFDFYDKKFTSAWDGAKQVVDRWKTFGGDRPPTFVDLYNAMVDLLLNPRGIRDPFNSAFDEEVFGGDQ